MNELIEINELKEIEPSKAKQIKEAFEPMVKMLEEFESKYNEVISESEKEITHDVTIKAKRIRLDIGKVRIETGKLKDKQKEYIKLEDKAIMGVHNILVWAVKEKEDKLKEIEDYFQIQEQKRLEALQVDRAEKLSKYIDDAYERRLSDMEEDVWNAYYQSKKKEYEDRIEAEKQAELARIAKEKAEAEERERIRVENEKLKKEAEEREAKAKIEAEARAKAEKERLAKEEAERKIREEKERKEREVHEAELRAEREARAKVEREEREKREALEAQIKAKEEAERKAKEEAQEEERKRKQAGDKDKLLYYAEEINSIVEPELTSQKAKTILVSFNNFIDRFCKDINRL